MSLRLTILLALFTAVSCSNHNGQRAAPFSRALSLAGRLVGEHDQPPMTPVVTVEPMPTLEGDGGSDEQPSTAPIVAVEPEPTFEENGGNDGRPAIGPVVTVEPFPILTEAGDSDLIPTMEANMEEEMATKTIPPMEPERSITPLPSGILIPPIDSMPSIEPEELPAPSSTVLPELMPISSSEEESSTEFEMPGPTVFPVAGPEEAQVGEVEPSDFPKHDMMPLEEVEGTTSKPEVVEEVGIGGAGMKEPKKPGKPKKPKMCTCSCSCEKKEKEKKKADKQKAKEKKKMLAEEKKKKKAKLAEKKEIAKQKKAAKKEEAKKKKDNKSKNKNKKKPKKEGKDEEGVKVLGEGTVGDCEGEGHMTTAPQVSPEMDTKPLPEASDAPGMDEMMESPGPGISDAPGNDDMMSNPVTGMASEKEDKDERPGVPSMKDVGPKLLRAWTASRKRASGVGPRLPSM